MYSNQATLAAAVRELEALVGYRVRRIRMPDRHTILIQYASAAHPALLLSCQPDAPRMHWVLGRVEKDQEAVTPMLLLCRKHLGDAELVGVEQLAFERVVMFHHLRRGPGPTAHAYRLIVELAGRRSNLILTDDRGIIVACARPVPADENRYRQILPGLPYCTPPRQRKVQPAELMANQHPLPPSGTGPAWRTLVQWLAGTDFSLAREICTRAGWPPERPLPPDEHVRQQLAQTARRLFAAIQEGRFRPTVRRNGTGEVVDCAPFPMCSWPPDEQEPRDSMLRALAELWQARLAGQRQRRLEHWVRKELQRRRQRARQRLGELEAAVERTRARLTASREAGECLLAWAHLVEPGKGSVRLPCPADPNRLVEIELDPSLSPVENAQRYFRAYRRAQEHLPRLQQQLQQARAELSWLEDLDYQLDCNPTSGNVHEVARQLGLQTEAAQPAEPGHRRGPLRARTSRGHLLLIGRNAAENHILITRLAKPQDFWFHVRGLPGCHVILKHPAELEPDQETLREAAAAAAYYSKASAGGKVAVDCCPVRYLRRPRGAPPGLVTYRGERTLWVEPAPPAVTEGDSRA